MAWDFPGGPVVKNLPANVGLKEQLSLFTTTTEAQEWEVWLLQLEKACVKQLRPRAAKKENLEWLALVISKELPWWLRWWTICLQYGRPEFDCWVGKILWRRKLATHSSRLAWEIPWTEEPDGLQSVESQKSQTWLSSWTTVLELNWCMWITWLPHYSRVCCYH